MAAGLMGTIALYSQNSPQSPQASHFEASTWGTATVTVSRLVTTPLRNR